MFLFFIYVYCKDTIPKIRNQYFQKGNCVASVPNSYFLVSVSDLYTPTIGLLQENRWTNRGIILIAHRHMNVEIRTEASQFVFWEYINGKVFAVWNYMYLKVQRLGSCDVVLQTKQSCENIMRHVYKSCTAYCKCIHK